MQHAAVSSMVFFCVSFVTRGVQTGKAHRLSSCCDDYDAGYISPPPHTHINFVVSACHGRDVPLVGLATKVCGLADAVLVEDLTL
jgi:hypothetical protein